MDIDIIAANKTLGESIAIPITIKIHVHTVNTTIAINDNLRILSHEKYDFNFSKSEFCIFGRNVNR